MQIRLYTTMGKTLDTLIIKKPTPHIVAMLERMKAHKVAQLEKLRSLQTYDYEIKVK